MGTLAPAAFALLVAWPAAALDGAALRHYAAGENAESHGALEMAGGHYGKALALLEADGLGRSEDAARLLADKARIAERLGERARAAALLARSLAITEAAVGRAHPDWTSRAARLEALGGRP